MIRYRIKKGYSLLLTVLSVGVITSSTAIALLLLGLSIEQNAFSVQVSGQAYELVSSCTEYAVNALREDLDYAGNEVVDLEIVSASYSGYGSLEGSCTIRPLAGFWNKDRIICTEAVYGNFTKRRQEVVLKRVVPDTIVTSWKEVNNITLCEPYVPVLCGNGVTQLTEQCDTNGDSGTCDGDCTYPTCGDGYINYSYTAPASGTTEECDAEGESVACNIDCTLASCGDSKVNNTAGEECDSGAIDSASCNADCTEAICGDSYINSAAGETCDDGGETAGCNADCTVTSCGDGYTNVVAGEECDDGNGDNGDECRNDCTIRTLDNAPTDYVGYWDLDESSGDADDQGPDDYDCDERNGASTSTDVPNSISGSPINSARSRNFDGNNDYLHCDKDTDLSPEPIAVSFWVKSDVTTQQADGIICATPGNNKWGKRGWGFTFEGSSSMSFFVEDWWSNYAHASNVTTTDWNHVVGMWDESTISIYVNGSLRDTDSYSGNMKNNQRVEIGRCGNDNYNINGKIDDVRIYDRVLTPEEITALAAGI